MWALRGQRQIPPPLLRETEDSQGSRRALGFRGLGCYMNFRDRARRAKTPDDPVGVPTNHWTLSFPML